jgi:hypothetical protein
MYTTRLPAKGMSTACEGIRVTQQFLTVSMELEQCTISNSRFVNIRACNAPRILYHSHFNISSSNMQNFAGTIFSELICIKLNAYTKQAILTLTNFNVSSLNMHNFAFLVGTIGINLPKLLNIT